MYKYFFCIRSLYGGNYVIPACHLALSLSERLRTRCAAAHTDRGDERRTNRPATSDRLAGRRAETHFTEAIKAAPQDYHAYADRGLVRALDERYEEARSDLTRASDLAPGMPTVEYNWAMYYKLQGQLDGAFAHFQNVLKKEPKNAWTLYGIATIYADRGETDPALDYLERAIAANPAVADAARAQDHFRSFHENARFQKLVQ